ncbi:MAG: hypothetical protein M5U34_46560, partial [Chloroflexi bacterium]|nr:hypothetical protein [Chloroflexota bacterium]
MGVKALDETTVQFKLLKPASYFLTTHPPCRCCPPCPATSLKNMKKAWTDPKKSLYQRPLSVNLRRPFQYPLPS